MTRFIDKGGDSKEVVKLMERLQEAIANYQVSEYRAIVVGPIDMGERYRNNKQSTTKSLISPYGFFVSSQPVATITNSFI